MALPTNSFRPKRYFRSKFREGKYLLASEATDLQLESHDLLREFLKLSYGNIAVQTSWKAEQMTLTQLRVRPGSAWDNGIPYLLKSGSDPKVISGILPAGVTLTESSATTSDAGGKNLNLSGALADDAYSIVAEATEELIRPVGTGAVDPYLQGTNVGEETANKLRLIYKLNVVKTADLSSTPTYPLGVGVNHLVNEIIVTPQTGVANFLISAVPIAQDVNGADVRITLDNANANLPFSTDANDYINGVFVDSDGNEMQITSITTTDAGATVQILLDREIDYNSALPKAALPIITNLVPYRLVKRDFYVSAGSGQPLGRHFYRLADFSSVAGSLTSLEDMRIVSGVNTFGVDHNVRLTAGGIISWNSVSGDLTWDTDFKVTIPGLSGSALIISPPGLINIPSDGMVAFCYLDRAASVDYTAPLTVLAKDQVPPSVDVYVFAERQSGRIYFPHGGSIGNGETGILGAFGATLDKDFSQDLIVDALSENGLDEVFAETFDDQDNVDLTKTSGLTYEPFAKQYKATAAARFLDYEGDVTPDSGTLPVDEIWTKVGTQAQSVGGGLLTLTDTSIGDQIAYSRTESNLTTLSQADFSFRLRQNSNGAQGGNYLTYMVKDGPSGKHFGLGITGTSVDLIDGAGTILQTFALAVNTMHTYRLVKVGNSVVQWYVDNILRGVYTYSDIATGSGGVSTVTWGTTVPTTSNWDIDFNRFNIYLSILQSLDVFRQTSLFYNAAVLPASDTPVWTKIGGAGGITEVITNGKLVLTDGSALNLINYERSEPTMTRQGDSEIEMRVKINSAGLASFNQFGMKLQDGKKDAALYIRDSAGQLKAGIYNAAAATLVSLEFDIDSDKYVVLKLRKVKDEGYQLLINGVFQDSIAYDEITDITSNKKMIFGSFNIASNYTASIDYVQYALPGVGKMAGTPIHDFLTIISSDDPFPKSWVSTDNGLSWHEMIQDQHTSIGDLEYAGGNLLVRVMLSTVNSTLTDYGVLYNATVFETEGQFNYDQQIAIALQTSFSLPWTYTPGSNELEVHYRPTGSGTTRKLTLGLDYSEPNSSTVDLVFTTAAGDVLEFKNSFVESPLVPPTVRFLDHDHDGSHGESDVLNPTFINVANDVAIGGDLTVSGFINGTSPLKLSGDNTGVLIGDDTLSVGTLELEVRTAIGAVPSLKLKRGPADDWAFKVGATGDLEMYANGLLRLSMPNQSDTRLMSQPPDISNSFYIRSSDLGGNGDAKIVLEVNNGANSWDLNLDNSDSDRLKLSANGVVKKVFHTGTTPNGTSAGLGEVATSASSGTFSSSSAVADVPNLSVTITTSGRPVFIGLIPDGTGSVSYISTSVTSGASAATDVRIVRDASTISRHQFRIVADTSATENVVQTRIPPGAIYMIDAPAAGTYTYKIQAGTTIGSDVDLVLIKLIAYEL